MWHKNVFTYKKVPKNDNPYFQEGVTRLTYVAPLVVTTEDVKTNERPRDFLDMLDGLVDTSLDGHLAQYLKDDSDPAFSNLPVTGGIMSIECIDEALFVLATYYTTETLTDSQLDVLREFTSGQFSDGGGEGLVQDLDMEFDAEFENLWEKIQLLPVR